MRAVDCLKPGVFLSDGIGVELNLSKMFNHGLVSHGAWEQGFI